jgi:hypothetical protein
MKINAEVHDASTGSRSNEAKRVGSLAAKLSPALCRASTQLRARNFDFCFVH